MSSPSPRATTPADLGAALTGAVVDKLASQGGLAFDPAENVLVAVNGGSNSITEFHVDGSRLSGRRSVASGGSRPPVSVTVSGNRLYVLNAGGKGSVQGFYLDSLHHIPGSARNLNLAPGSPSQFLNTPGQIGLTPGGRHLIVTTKANGSDIDVFAVAPDGSLSAAPTANPSATPVPFGFTFDPAGDLVVTEAGASALTTYAIHGDGTLTELHSVTNGFAALCWVTKAGDPLLRCERRQRDDHRLQRGLRRCTDDHRRDRDRRGSPSTSPPHPMEPRSTPKLVAVTSWTPSRFITMDRSPSPEALWLLSFQATAASKGSQSAEYPGVGRDRAPRARSRCAL